MDRRSFLMASLAASAVAQTQEEAINTAFIGTGNRGSYLLDSVLKLPGTKVVALCDTKPDRLDKAASAAVKDKPATFADYRRLLERKDVQAVFIATPCDLHAEMAIAAIKAGKHVYCEKPLGVTAESVGEVLKAARNAKTVFQVGLQMRSSPRLTQVIEKIRGGVLGKLIMVKAQRHAGEDLDHDGPSKDWFFDAKRSGDVLVEMAVHNLDECNRMIGSLPDRAGGFGGNLLWVNDPPGRTNMDGYTLSYDYQNGVKLSFTQVFFHPHGLPGGGGYYYAYGTEGAVDVDAGVFYPLRRGAAPVKLIEGTFPRPQVEPHIAAFFECVRTGAKPPATVVDGATATLTCILGREAIYKRRVVTWRELGVEI